MNEAAPGERKWEEPRDFLQRDAHVGKRTDAESLEIEAHLGCKTIACAHCVAIEFSDANRVSDGQYSPSRTWALRA